MQVIVEAFTVLQDQLNRERRVMEKQIERVILNTVGMYGEMCGIVGTSLPEIPALELEEHKVLDGPDGLQWHPESGTTHDASEPSGTIGDGPR